MEILLRQLFNVMVPKEDLAVTIIVNFCCCIQLMKFTSVRIVNNGVDSLNDYIIYSRFPELMCALYPNRRRKDWEMRLYK